MSIIGQGFYNDIKRKKEKFLEQAMMQMPQVLESVEGVVLITKLEIANSFTRRLRGLIGVKVIANDYGLFFPACKSIHSYMMRSPFDLAFVDEGMTVTDVHRWVQPGKVISTQSGKHCLEMAPGKIDEVGIRVGLQVKIVN